MKPSFFDNAEEIEAEVTMKPTIRRMFLGDWHEEPDYEKWYKTMHEIHAEFETGPTMAGMGIFPEITNWLYLGEDCYDVEEDGAKLVEKNTLSLKDLQQTDRNALLPEFPTLMERLKAMSGKEYHIFTMLGEGTSITQDRKVTFLGVFTLDGLECIYRNRIVLNKHSDTLQII